VRLNEGRENGKGSQGVEGRSEPLRSTAVVSALRLPRPESD
jgi:hypothetical protein